MSDSFDPRRANTVDVERDVEAEIRPREFEDFSGQEKVVENLRIFVKAALMRGEALDHVLLHGPPGLGKTTLAHIISRELNVNLYRDWETDRKSTRLNSSHRSLSRMPSSA